MNRSLTVFFVLLLGGGSRMCFAQSPGGTVPMTVNVVQTPLTVTQGTFDASPLTSGDCYRIPADIQNPVAYGSTTNQAVANVTVSLTETVISGDILSDVLVSFLLPTVLTPTTSGPGLIHCTYDNLNAAYGPTGSETTFFNPQVESPKAFQLDANGELNLVLSANLCVDKDAGADTYEGDALIAAQYIGANP